jgi:pyroglutamyl-peptidase
MPENVTSRLVADLAGRARDVFPAFEIRAAILPTEWDRAPELLDNLLSGFQPSTVILFGVSGRARGFEVETVARNAATLTPDAVGLPPLSSRIDPSGLDQIAVRFPAACIVARLRRMQLPARVSRDAGRYLCNATLYRLLSRSDVPAWPRVAGFVHVPANLRTSGTTGRLSYERALVGAQEILSVCLGRDAVVPQAVQRRGCVTS